MDTIFLESIPVFGCHGETGREKLDPQKYEVSLELELDTEKSGLTDDLSDTYDYKKAYEIVRRIVSDESYSLIESVAYRIADRICRDSKIYKVKVTVKKISAFSDTSAGITIVRSRVPSLRKNGLKEVNFSDLFGEIRKVGAVSVPFLEDWYREELLDEARGYEYVEQPKIVGAGKVKEELSSVKNFYSNSLFFELRNDIEGLLKKEQADSGFPFSEAPLLNELTLQKYNKGSLGITPHMDHSYCRDLICLFVLTGSGRLAVCQDREGNNARDIQSKPGNLIILRAPGFDGSDLRPFHFITDIQEERIVFGLRHNVRME